MKYNAYEVTEGTTVAVSEIEAKERNGFLVHVVEAYGSSAYGRDLRGIVRALWNGSMDINQAFDSFDNTVRIGLTRAWHEGARECNVQPSELTPQERTEMERVIWNESARIFPFLLHVEQNNKANGGKYGDLLSRVSLWSARYSDVVTRAKLMACADQKTRWTINYTRKVEENCDSCLKLDGKVKRASYWYEHQVQPQNPPNPKLICQGWQCGCGLPNTDEPMSRGPLPNLP